MMMSSSSGSSDADEPEGTRVEEALRVTTRQIKALQKLVNSFEDIPPANDPPQFPPANVELAAPTRDVLEADRKEIRRINRQYYEGMNERDVRGILDLWRTDGEVQMYANEDKIITG